MDWENHKFAIVGDFTRRKHCVSNEKHDEIVKDIEKVRQEYGDVLLAPKREKRDSDKHADEKSAAKRKKPNPPKRKTAIAYNGRLLPFSLETLNNSIVAFFDELSKWD